MTASLSPLPLTLQAEFLKTKQLFLTRSIAESLERLTAINAEVATVLGSIPKSSGTVESEGRQMKQC
jgi:hypothetical protein